MKGYRAITGADHDRRAPDGQTRLADLLRQTDLDLRQPNLVNTGGVTEGEKIAALAEAEHVSFAPHNPQGPVATAICAPFAPRRRTS